ncbi:MAG TPA: FAD:protein FMN transferase [Puia sp.]|nr:FAD:protein FMN transferase [Puia sp.]
MNEYSRHERLMGSQFELKILCENEARATMLLQEAVEEIKRIEKLLTEFDSGSCTSRINNHAGVSAVAVEEEVFDLLTRSIRISRLTQGAFDITSGALKKLYKFDNSAFQLPPGKDIQETLGRVGFQYIHLGRQFDVFLEKKDMHISFSAIGKGYAADCAAKMLQRKNVDAGVVNASGDLTVWGRKNDNSLWKVGIANPDDDAKILCWVALENASVATSGDYYQHFLYQGVRYSHNINPKTGLPVSGLKSVTVISVSAELSDALATAVYVMGKNAGMHFINQLPGVHCILIDGNNRLSFSKNLKHKDYEFKLQP